MFFLVRVLPAQFTVANDEVQEGAAVPPQGFQIQFAGLDPRGGDIVIDERQELAACGVHFLQIRRVSVQPQIFRLLLQCGARSPMA